MQHIIFHAFRVNKGQCREPEAHGMDVVMVLLEKKAYSRRGAAITPPSKTGEEAVIFVEDPDQRFLRDGCFCAGCYQKS